MKSTVTAFSKILSLERLRFTIGPTSYRGPERRTSKTAEKQPKKVPGGPRVKCRENSRKTAGGATNSRKTAVLHASGVFPAVFRLFPQHFTREKGGKGVKEGKEGKKGKGRRVKEGKG